MIKAALPHLMAGSAIVNTGSETGSFDSGQLLDYCATKGAVHALTKGEFGLSSNSRTGRRGEMVQPPSERSLSACTGRYISPRTSTNR
jgi:hypothetical protein